jgi:RHS repeat-associated protein
VNYASTQYVAAAEYRYDSARARYRVRTLDPREYVCQNNICTCTPQNGTCVGVSCCYNDAVDRGFLRPMNNNASEGQWSDYDGSAVHGDYTVAVAGSPQTATVTNATAHAPGLGQTPWNGAQPPSAENAAYFHGNLVGTNGRMTNASGGIVRRAVYTAFGEPIDVAQPPSAVETRYGYCGAWGYQGSPYSSGDPLADLGWLLVGARCYDPSSGRFVQRDPIGIRGGSNVYAYCGNLPTIGVDPSGELPLIPLLLAVIIAIDYGAQYANAPSTGDSIHRGGAGSSPVGWASAAALGSWLVRGICGGHEAAAPADDGTKPPGWTPDWQRLPASRESEHGFHWYDPDGGEWHHHLPDRWHDEHWDYNPWNHPLDYWRDVYPMH